jgi:L-lactate utilization protein LutB
MSDDYLKSQREKSLKDDSKTSEAELHANNEGILDGWQAIQDIRRKIATAKQEAIKKVDEDFKEELKDAEDHYALLITLTR